MAVSGSRWAQASESMMCLLLHLHGHTKRWPSICSGCDTEHMSKVARSVCDANLIIFCAIGGQQMTVRTSFGPAARVSMSPRLGPEEHAHGLGCLYSQSVSLEDRSALVCCAVEHPTMFWRRGSPGFRRALPYASCILSRCFP